MRRISLSLSLASVLLFLAIAGNGLGHAAEIAPEPDQPLSAAALGPIFIEITDSGYIPAEITLPPHTTVTWVNEGTASHTVTSESGSVPNSPTLQPRSVYSYTFHNEGAFPYRDTLNPGLTGVITIAEGAVLPPPTSTPAPEPVATAVPPAAPVPPTPTPGAQDGGQPTASPAPATPTSAHDVPDVVQTSSDPGAAATSPDSGTAPRMTSSTTNIDAGTEYFGNPSFSGGVYEVTVQAGDTITWTVVDGVHNVFECGDNFANALACSGASFSSEVLTAGASFSQTFSSAGTYYYLCTIHPLTMRGKVTVEGASAPPPIDEPDDNNNSPSNSGTGSDGGGGAAGTSGAVLGSSNSGASTLANGGLGGPVDGGLPLASILGAVALAAAGAILVAGALVARRWSM